MNKAIRGIPTDADVRRLLDISSSSSDRRAIAAVILILSQGLSLTRLNRLSWANWDLAGRTLIIPSRGGRHAVISLTPLMTRVLASIPRGGKALIFAPLSPSSPTLAILFTQVLARASLTAFTAADFVSWSTLQSPATRLSTATAY